MPALIRERSIGMNCEVKCHDKLVRSAIKITEESVEETVTVLVVENRKASGKLLCEQSLLPIPGSYFLFPGDRLQDGTRVYMVFRNGIKTGRSNIATVKNGICFEAISLTLRNARKSRS